MILVLHGVNLNCLGRRDPDHYGTLTLQALEEQISQFARELELQVDCRQTNDEREYVQWLQEAGSVASGLILNPGAWTHYAWSLRDALEIAALPAVEVHLSDIYQREAFRRVSVIGDLCITSIVGQGVDGYRAALAVLREKEGNHG